MISKSNRTKSISIDIKVGTDYIKHYKRLVCHPAVAFLIKEFNFLG